MGSLSKLMIITHQFSELASLDRRVHLAMGVFDGVHMGHREVIAQAVEQAQSAGEIAGVLTFDPFPIQVVAPDRAPQRILATIDHKVQLLRDLGVELLLIVPFDHDFAALSATEFLDLVSESGHLAHISVGEDWKFGRGREGKLEFLADYCEQQGIRLSATSPVIQDHERISSTRIRQCVRDGNLRAAAEMLGRSYSLFGKVVQGDQLGRQLGYPTANIDTQNELLPPNGVYAVRSLVQGELINGVANLGVRPTVNGQVKTLEVHFFDFAQDLYGQELEVELGKCLRPEKKFAGLEQLKTQIAADCDHARDLIAAQSAWF